MANPVDSFKGLPSWGKAAVAAGGAGAVYLMYRARQNAAAAASSPAAGSLSTPDTASGAGTGNGLPVTGTGTTGPAVLGTTTGFGTNDAWSQAAQTGLSDIGFDPQTVAIALGTWLDGGTLTAGQAAIVNAARAEYGNPPVSPPAVVLAPSTGPAATGNTASTITSGHVVSESSAGGVVAWTPVGPATSWQVTLTGPGSENGRKSTVTRPQATYGGLPSGHTFYVTVQPLPSGTPGRIDFKTTKG